MKLKHYIVSHYESGWQAEFDIDLDKAVDGCLESLNFFGDPITREDDSPEQIVGAFLTFWAPCICRTSMDHGRMTGEPDAMIRAMGKVEGCIPLNGKCGVKLVYCDAFAFDGDQFDIVGGSINPEPSDPTTKLPKEAA